MAKREDIAGQVFNHLTAVSYAGNRRWLFRCDCGRETVARTSEVKSGRITSCGHILSETARAKIAANTLRHHDGTSLPHIEHIMAGKTRVTNKTGVTGVTTRRFKSGISYRARITIRGKELYLGEFPTLEQAAAARRRAEQQYFQPILDALKKSP